MIARDLYKLLADRYRPPEWALLNHVRNQTGFLARKRVRTADAIAFNLWPSRGLEIYGFEIKVSRGDWLREKKDPAKAEELFGYCHRWWIVAPPKVVEDYELPPSWGLLLAQKNRLVAKVTADPKDPNPLSREFVAAALRSATEVEKPSDMELAEAHRNGVLTGRAEMRRNLDRAQEGLKTLKDAVDVFRKKSGISLEYSGPEVGDVVRTLLGNGNIKFDIERALSLCRTAAEALEAAQKQVKELEGFRG